MTETPTIPEAAGKAFRKLWAGLMAVKPQLDAPYPDDARWTPWTRFVEPRLVDLQHALATANPEVYVVHHHDIEKHAEHFNEGYDEAMRQGIGGAESRGWLTEKVYPLLKDHVDPENAHHLVDHIADALLSEADLSDPEPTFTASEVKELTTKATAVALALGRKEAGDEIAAAIENDHGWPTFEQAKALEFAARIARSLGNRDLPSQPTGGGSDDLTAHGGHSDLPPTPEAARDPHGVVDLVGALREAVDAARKRRLARSEEGQ